MECPNIAEPLTKGLKFTVFRSELEKTIPELPAFLSEAGNLCHGTEQQQTAMQTLLQIHRKNFGILATFGDYKWNTVVKHITASHTNRSSM